MVENTIDLALARPLFVMILEGEPESHGQNIHNHD
jgi:hypothetical protein